jgi:hypothetical protein
MRPISPSSTPTTPSTLTITLKSARNPLLDLTLPSQQPTTSILDLKSAVASHLNLPGTDKVRILWNKRPCKDSQSLKDVIGDGIDKREAEFGVMIMGGMPTQVEGEKEEKGEERDVVMMEAPVAVGGVEGVDVLKGEAFWDDLRGFLLQRVRNERVAAGAVGVFRRAWESEGGGLG